ncbi:MAG: lytic transglycosylase domain-containing protein [Marinilabiliales bacterium]|nr:lytic transglycosylase domain-containing protein [Marinilabiliales bacterium]
MEKFNNRFLRLSLFLSVIAVCVVLTGLFVNSSKIDTPAVNPAPEVVNHYIRPVEIPAAMEFAGEKIALQNFDVKEALDRELLVNSYFQSQTLMYLKKANRYFHVIVPILKEHDIPEDFKYLCLAESGFQEKIVSPAGATGLWQLMKKAAIENGLEVNNEVDERFNMERSTQAACRYLKNSFRQYGSWIIVAASYNAGINGIKRQSELQDSRNYFDLLLNDETSRYVYRILALKLILENPERYGFQVADAERYPILTCKEITLDKPVSNLAAFAHENGINYKILKYFNPWLRQSSLKNTLRKRYVLKIPVAGTRTFDTGNN